MKRLVREGEWCKAGYPVVVSAPNRCSNTSKQEIKGNLALRVLAGSGSAVRWVGASRIGVDIHRI